MKALGPSKPQKRPQVATLHLARVRGPARPKLVPGGLSQISVKNSKNSKYLKTDGDSKEMVGDLK